MANNFELLVRKSFAEELDKHLKVQLTKRQNIKGIRLNIVLSPSREEAIRWAYVANISDEFIENTKYPEDYLTITATAAGEEILDTLFERIEKLHYLDRSFWKRFKYLLWPNK